MGPPPPAELLEPLAMLREGKVVAAATETFFGLLADASRPDAVDCLLSLKPRGADQGIPLLIPSLGAWEELVPVIPPLALTLAREFWPGPLTIATRADQKVDPRLILDGKIAVRLPGPSAAAEIVRWFNRPLTATSANLPGEPPAVRSAQVLTSFAMLGARLHVVPGEAPGGSPSTVVAVDGETVRTVRQGAIAAERVRAACRGA